MLGAIEKYRSEDKESLTKRKKQQRNLKDKNIVDVVLRLHRLFFVLITIIRKK